MSRCAPEKPTSWILKMSLSRRATEYEHVPDFAVQVDRQLNGIPVINDGMDLDTADPDRYVAAVEQTYSRAVRPFVQVFKLSRRKRYEITGLNLELFKMIDNTSTVDDILGRLMTTYKLSFFEARGIVTGYFSGLMAKGIISLIYKQDSA